MMTGRQLLADIDACRVGPGECAVWWLGQHGFVAKLGATVCYLDPYLSASPRRAVPPLLAPEQVTNADLILGSHDHDDHVDRCAWPALAAASPRAQFVVPELLRGTLAAQLGIAPERFLGVDADRAHEMAGVTVHGVPAAHELLAPDPASGLHPCVGFVVAGNGFCLYHAGDTCLYEGLQPRLRRWRLDLAFLPINGRDAARLAAGCIGNMTYQEAADLAGAIAPGITVPAHYEMFAGNSQDPAPFVDYMRVKYPHLAVAVPAHGQRLVLKATGR